MSRIRTAFVLGSVLLTAGAVLLLVGLLAGDAGPGVNGFQRLPFSHGGGVVELGTGRWVGYYEVGGSAGPAAVPNFRALIHDPAGDQVNVGNYVHGGAGSQPTTYEHNGRHAVAVLQFDASRSGSYKVQLMIAGALPPSADLAIGRDIAGGASTSTSSVPAVLGAIAALAGVGLIGAGFVGRSRRPHVVSGAP